MENQIKNKEKSIEELNTDIFAIEIFREGKWIALDLAQLLNEPAKKMLRQNSFRFVLYGQLESRSIVPQPGEPEHERFAGTDSSKPASE